jgi:bacterial/archaeal transporter family-2 protein
VGTAGYFLLAFLAGAALPIQVGLNGELAHWVGSPVRASLISVAVSTLALGMLTLVAFRGWPSLSKLSGVPWWVWLGGLLGAFYVTGSILTGPRIGAVAFAAAVVSGQLVASVVLDNYGWVGFTEKAVTPGRIGGVILVAAGVALVRVF